MTVRTLGQPLPPEQQLRLQREIYDENAGDTLSIESLLAGLELAGELLTTQVVEYEKAHAAYVAKC